MTFVSGKKNLGDNLIQTMISEIVLAVSVAVEQSLFDQGRKEIAKLAKDTGFMMQTIEGDLMNQIASQSGQTRIRISFSKNKLAAICKYIIFHWNRSPYTNPTKQGSIPIYPSTIVHHLKADIKQKLIAQFEGARFKVTTN